MDFKEVSGELKSNKPEDIAGLLLDFFVWQYKEVSIEDIKLRAEYEAKMAANNAAQRLYDAENELGFGCRVPHNQHELNILREKIAQSRNDVLNFKVILDFVQERILKGLI